MEVITLHDAPKINGFTFTHPPTDINVYWQPQYTHHRLADGSLATYNKGFILKGSLGWGNGSWIDEDEFSNVVAMYNQLTATAQFQPRPNKYSSRTFNVQISNDLNFVPHGGLLVVGKQLYEGSIVFESSIGDITATASELF